MTFGAYSTGKRTWSGSVTDEDTGFGWDAARRLIDAWDSLVTDCRSMSGTFAVASAPAGEHTLVAHDHESAAMKPMPEMPTEACDRSEDKVVACVRLPRP